MQDQNNSICQNFRHEFPYHHQWLREWEWECRKFWQIELFCSCTVFSIMKMLLIFIIILPVLAMTLKESFKKTFEKSLKSEKKCLKSAYRCFRSDTQSQKFFCLSGPTKMIPSAYKKSAESKKMQFHLTKFFRSRWWWWYCSSKFYFGLQSRFLLVNPELIELESWGKA